MPSNPFLDRINATITAWLETEWATKEAIKLEAAALGWNNHRKERFREACLTCHSLAHRVDHMSLSKLRRELAKLGAPPPGTLIRQARLTHARKLLVSTRLLIREVAEQSGYRSDKQFTASFIRSHGIPPSEYRRAVIANGSTVAPSEPMSAKPEHS